MPDDSRSPTPPIQTTVAPPRGLQFDRRFSEASGATYEPRTITDPGTGEQITIGAPTHWSDHAVTILATKYRRKTGVPVGAEPWRLPLSLAPIPRGTPATGGETSARQIFHRLAGCWASWGTELGYFDPRNARVFADEIVAMLEQQRAAPNSPQWFNTGLHWAYGIEGAAQGHYAITDEGVSACTNAYERPQVHACFIQPVADDLCSDAGIMGLAQREAKLFKFGSGTGTNFSAIRGLGEPLSGGGVSSGLLSFLSIGNAVAGAVKSGGTTRRAAKMVTVDVDHPDIEEFIGWKEKEERKIAALIAGGFGGVGFETEAHATVGGQNANNSVRVGDDFMYAVERDDQWDLIRRTDGKVGKTVSAVALWDKICTAAHACADPGLQFDTTINEWHTCPESGRINASNPCSEYMFLDNTACNLASLNLAAFLRDDGVFDVGGFQHAVRLWSVVLDVSVSMAGYPSEAIAEESRKFRTTGLGYTNLGGALMRKGIPYASARGEEWCSFVTSFMAAAAWRTSAELAQLLGPFPAYAANKEHVLAVLSRHRDAAGMLWAGDWAEAIEAVATHGARNAQTTLLAPTGTISYVLGCSSTGIEPVFSLRAEKQLAGSGSFSLGCPAADAYLGAAPGERRTYDPADPVLACANAITPEAHLRMMAAAQPFLCGAISKTINMPAHATVEDVSQTYKHAWRLGLKAVAIYRDQSKTAQPLTSVAAEPDADGRVAAPPLPAFPPDSTPVEPPVRGGSSHFAGYFVREDSPALARGERERPQLVHPSTTAKMVVGGVGHHFTVGQYSDGRPCEVFVVTGKQGSTVRGWADAFGVVLSLYLQAGGSLPLAVDKLRSRRFEPAGFVSGAPLGIRTATSPVDALSQLLDALGAQAPGAALEPAHATVGSVASVSVRGAGETCAHCGGLDLRREGSCLTCAECGTTTGCG
jgi:adenosylcobalamin-dependent ribonucleoside-diphosphate reductase